MGEALLKSNPEAAVPLMGRLTYPRQMAGKIGPALLKHCRFPLEMLVLACPPSPADTILIGFKLKPLTAAALHLAVVRQAVVLHPAAPLLALHLLALHLPVLRQARWFIFQAVHSLPHK